MATMLLFSNTRAKCFDYYANCEQCSQRFKFKFQCKQSSNTVKGFDFSFGSLTKDTVSLCRNFKHLKILDCLKQSVTTSCSNLKWYDRGYSNSVQLKTENAKRQYISAIWSWILDSKRFRKATDFICSLKALNVSQWKHNQCYLQNDRAAQKCSTIRTNNVNRGFALLNANKNANQHTEIRTIRKTLNKHECRGITEKIRCLARQMEASGACRQQEIDVIGNYFWNTLPDADNCVATATRALRMEKVSLGRMFSGDGVGSELGNDADSDAAVDLKINAKVSNNGNADKFRSDELENVASFNTHISSNYYKPLPAFVRPTTSSSSPSVFSSVWLALQSCAADSPPFHQHYQHRQHHHYHHRHPCHPTKTALHKFYLTLGWLAPVLLGTLLVLPPDFSLEALHTAKHLIFDVIFVQILWVSSAAIALYSALRGNFN